MSGELDDGGICPSEHLCNMPAELVGSLSGYSETVMIWLIENLPGLLNQSSDFFVIDRYLAFVNELTNSELIFNQSHRIALINILYNNAFSSGLGLRLRVTTTCYKLLKLKPSLPPESLLLDYRPLLNTLWSVCEEVDNWRAADTFGCGIRHEDRIALGNLAVRARKYFHDDSYNEIKYQLLPFLFKDNRLFFRILGLFSLLLPFKRHATKDTDPELMIVLLNALKWMNQSTAVKSVLFQMFSRCAHHGVFDFGPYLPLLYSSFVQALGLAVEQNNKDPLPDYGHTKSWPNDLKFLRRYSGSKNGLVRDMAKTVAYTLSPSNFSMLQHFLHFISSYLHPNNYGTWSNLLGTFFEAFAIHFTQRFKHDTRSNHPKLTDDFSKQVLREFIKSGTPALYSNSFTLVHSIAKMYSCFSKLEPEIVEPSFLQFVDLTLRSPTSSQKRRLACLKLSAYVLPAFRQCDWFYDHVYCCAESLNPSDTNQLRAAINLMAVFFNLCEDSDQDFIEQLAPHLMVKLFHLCENMPEYSKNSSFDASMKADFKEFFVGFLRVLPTEMHRLCSQYIFDFIFSRRIENARRLLGVMCNAASMSSPSWVLSHYIPLFITSIRVASGNEIDWLLYHLSCLIRKTGSHLLPYLADLLPIIKLGLSSENIGRLSHSNKIIRHILKTLTDVYPFQFIQDHRQAFLPDNEFSLAVTWHLPTKEELHAVSGFVQEFIRDPVCVLTTGHVTRKTTETCVRSLLTLQSVARGISTLLNRSRCRIPELHELDPWQSDILVPIMVLNQTIGDYLYDAVLCFLSRCREVLEDRITIYKHACDLVRVLSKPVLEKTVAQSLAHAKLLESQKNFHTHHRCSVRRILIDSTSNILSDRFSGIFSYFFSITQTSEVLNYLLDEKILMAGSSPFLAISRIMLQCEHLFQMQSFTAKLFEVSRNLKGLHDAYVRQIAGLFLIPTVALYICSKASNLYSLIEIWPSFATVDDITVQQKLKVVFRTYWGMLQFDSLMECSSRSLVEDVDQYFDLIGRKLPAKHQIAALSLAYAMLVTNHSHELGSVFSSHLENLLSDDHSLQLCSIFILPLLLCCTHHVSGHPIIGAEESSSKVVESVICENLRPETVSAVLNPWIQEHFTALLESLSRKKNGTHQNDKIRSEMFRIFRLKAKFSALITNRGSVHFSLENVRLWQSLLESNVDMMPLFLGYLQTASLEEGLDKERSACFAELLCGVILNLGQVADTSQAQEQTIVLIWSFIHKIEPEMYPDWLLSLRFASSQVPFSLMSPLVDETVAKAFTKGQPTLLAQFFLEILSGFLLEYTWQCRDIACQILNANKGLFEFRDSAIVRQALSEVIHDSVCCLFQPDSQNRMVSLKPVLVLDHSCLVTFLENVLEICSTGCHALRQCLEIFCLFMIESCQEGSMMVFGNLLNHLAVPVLATGFSQTDPELLSFVEKASHYLGWIGFSESDICEILPKIIRQCQDPNFSSRGKSSLLKLARLLISRHSYFLSKECVQDIYMSVCNLLADPEITCRNSAADTLTVLYIHTRLLDFPKTTEVILKCQQLIDVGGQVDGKVQIARRHGGILGLIGLVRAAAYDIPDWLGDVLNTLASYANEKPPIGDSIRETFINWRHLHVDDFHDVQDKLNEKQLEAIREVNIAPSYIV